MTTKINQASSKYITSKLYLNNQNIPEKKTLSVPESQYLSILFLYLLLRLIFKYYINIKSGQFNLLLLLLL